MWLFYTAKDLVKYYYFVPIMHIFIKKKVGIQVVLKLNYNILVFLFSFDFYLVIKVFTGRYCVRFGKREGREQ